MTADHDDGPKDGNDGTSDDAARVRSSRAAKKARAAKKSAKKARVSKKSRKSAKRGRRPAPQAKKDDAPAVDVPEVDVPAGDSPHGGVVDLPIGANSIDLSRLFDSPQRSSGPDETDQAPLADDEMIVVAVHGMVLFPGVVLPVVVSREKSILALQAAMRSDRPIGLLLQREAGIDAPSPADLYHVGTTASIVRYVTTPDGAHHVIVQGQKRFRATKFVRSEPYFVCKVELLGESSLPKGRAKAKAEKSLEARVMHLKFQASEALSLLPETPDELLGAIQESGSPSALTDLIATFMELPNEEKQQILETAELIPRMELVSAKLAHLIEVLSLSKELRVKTRGTMEKAQREYFLREQLKTIQAELGEDAAPELQELSEAIGAAGLPADIEKDVRKELARLERMPEQAAEYGMLRNYLETVVELPWSKLSTDRIDLKRAKRILDEDHYGLEKVKRRILEFLAVRKLKPDGKSPILCLVGPPGVGKTSLGRSVARAMGREFVRISLGGVHDESEIRGHRRTYVGAMPGSIVQGMRRAGKANPVFMLDEMDKLGQSFQGDPSSALLEVLDPEQNKTFKDHYLGVPFDLSRVMFIATANVLDQIPGPLRDRCEVIELNSYTEQEKLEIAKRYLIDRQRSENGLTLQQFKLDDAALLEIVRHHTAEAGCRNLERKIGAVARWVATRIASNERRSMTVRRSDVSEILGPRRFEDERRLRTAVPGVATGLAWTPFGGDILFIETTLMPGKGEIVLTGQLGDVMKESARAAVSLVKSRAVALGLDEKPFEDKDLHIHLPAGAIPKDGPSAGVTLFTALVSLLTKRRIDPELAMTGEISLRGLVLPVGGIKEKVIAAHRAGIRRILLPKANAKDELDIPASTRRDLELIYVEKVDEVLEQAFAVPSPRPAARRAAKKARSKKSAKKRAAKKPAIAKVRRKSGAK
jgi:ATP-dependent Lon protease